MNFPIQFGAPQIILLLIALGGFALFVHAAHSLLRGEKHYNQKYWTAEEKEAYYESNHRRLPRRRHLRLRRGLSGVLLIAVATSLLWLTFLVQAYLGLTSDIPVAHVVATSLVGVDHAMSVTLTLYDQNGQPITLTDPNGHTTTSLSYVVYGDEWMLQGDFIKVVPWMNVLGVHSGYKVTRLEGRYDDINLEQTARRSAYALNGGDDGFFQNMQSWHGWISPFIDAEYGTATFVGPGTYDVFASQTGLYPRPVS